MANTLRLYCEDPDGILHADNYGAGAIMRVHWSATEAGVYVNLTTVPVVAATLAYRIFDTAGTSSTFYKTRFESADATILSDWSEPFQVGGEDAGFLCSLEDVKQRLGITGTTDDEQLAEIIRQVSDEILGYTGREFVGTPGDVTRTFDLDLTAPTLYIPGGIRSITTLGYAASDQPDSGGTYTTITSTYYYLRPLAHERTSGWPATRLELASGYLFYAGRSTVQIVGKFGWSEVPPAITRIAAAAVVSHFMSKGAEGPRAAVGPDGRMMILRDISPADMAILASYREPFV